MSKLTGIIINYKNGKTRKLNLKGVPKNNIESISVKYDVDTDVRKNKLKGLVIAGNKFQFDNWLKENKLDRQDYLYVNEHNWRGIHGVPIHKVGTWYDRADLDINQINQIERCWRY